MLKLNNMLHFVLFSLELYYMTMSYFLNSVFTYYIYIYIYIYMYTTFAFFYTSGSLVVPTVDHFNMNKYE